MRREEIIAEAKTWLGTPYHHQGAIKGAGVDCAKLLIEVYSIVGDLPKIDAGNYAKDWHLHRSEEKYLQWVMKFCDKTEKPQAGDIALFKFGRCLSHGAIVLDENRVIHSYYKLGCVISGFDDIELKGRLDSFWTIREQ